MGVVELLTDLRRRGFTLTPEGDRLRISPGSRLTPELRQAILGRKRELLALLGQRAEEVFFQHPGPCPTCGGREWWISVYHVRICAMCHPPADKSLVAEWIGDREKAA